MTARAFGCLRVARGSTSVETGKRWLKEKEEGAREAKAKNLRQCCARAADRRRMTAPKQRCSTAALAVHSS